MPIYARDPAEAIAIVRDRPYPKCAQCIVGREIDEQIDGYPGVHLFATLAAVVEFRAIPPVDGGGCEAYPVDGELTAVELFIGEGDKPLDADAAAAWLETVEPGHRGQTRRRLLVARYLERFAQHYSDLTAAR